MTTKRDTLEQAIRMMVRAQNKLAKEGVALHFSFTAGPLPPKQPPSGKRSGR